MSDIKNIAPEVLTVLKNSKITGNVLVLPPVQLPRPLYVAVDKVLRNAGGLWKRGTGHVFDSDPSKILGIAIDSGVSIDFKKKRQAFYTPANIAKKLVERAQVAGKSVLEPSCGNGALIRECLTQQAADVYAVEIDEETAHNAATEFARKDVTITCTDFLKLKLASNRLFDRIVMNPPFSKGQDIKHVGYALSLLAPGGILVSVMSPVAPQKEAFQQMLEDYDYDIEELEKGAFKESGTTIQTIIVTIEK